LEVNRSSAHEKEKQSGWMSWVTLGPGLAFLAAMTGPGSIVSNAAAGASYGYRLLWALALALLFRFVWVDISARYVLVTGETLLQGYARMGQWLVWTILGASILVRHSTNLYTILLMGNAVHTLVPLPFESSRAAWTLLFSLIGIAMMFWGGYPLVERGSQYLVSFMTASLLLAAILSRPQPAQIAWGILVPSLPGGQGTFSAILILTAMIGAQVGTLSNLSYAYFVGEKGWQGAAAIGQHRRNLLLSFGLRFVMGALLQIAAAETLLPLGTQPRNAEDLTRIFTGTLGSLGGIGFGLGLWAVCFSNFVSGTTGYALIIRDICRRYVPRLSDPQKSKLEARKDPVYRWTVFALGFSPLYIIILQAEPVALVLAVRSLVVILIPILGTALLWLANDKSLMGSHRNGWLSNGAMVLMLIISLYLTVRTALDLLQNMGIH
jgi:Mn2+/Fe2+ NRAMP family transporter